MRPKTADRGRGETPGPGQYDADNFGKVLTRSPGTVMGTARRGTGKEGEGLPGPGQYDTRGGIGGPKYGFGSSARGGKSLNASFPSPGSYNLPGSLDQQHGWSLSGRYPNKPQEDLPGPGAYSPQNMHGMPAYSVGHSARSRMNAGDGPGPGQYNPGLKPSPGVK